MEEVPYYNLFNFLGKWFYYSLNSYSIIPHNEWKINKILISKKEMAIMSYLCFFSSLLLGGILFFRKSFKRFRQKTKVTALVTLKTLTNYEKYGILYK